MGIYGRIQLVVSLPGGFPRKGVNIISTYEKICAILGIATFIFNVVKHISKNDDEKDTKK